jgi:PKD repeat protein
VKDDVRCLVEESEPEVIVGLVTIGLLDQGFTWVDPPSCTVGQPCQFDDKSDDSDGDVVGWSWNFGDGGTMNVEDPSYTYQTAGTYSVTLTVTDDDGATGSVTQSVTVSEANSAPAASFTHDACVAGVECQFTDTSTDNSGIVSWRWDFGDFTEASGEQHPRQRARRSLVLGRGCAPLNARADDDHEQ